MWQGVAGESAGQQGLFVLIGGVVSWPRARAGGRDAARGIESPPSRLILMAAHLLAIDQGTTGTTALVLSLEGDTLGRSTVEFPQHFPQPGWSSYRRGRDLEPGRVAVKGASVRRGSKPP